MPLLPSPSIKVPFWHFNGHVQSIYPSLIRRVKFTYQHRERLELVDGDFVDLDWSVSKKRWHRLVIVQAINDPFLLPNCMPIADAESNPHLFLEMPQQGGHCGFMEKHNEFSWAEKRALAFSLSILENSVK